MKLFMDSGTREDYFDWSKVQALDNGLMKNYVSEAGLGLII